MHKQKSYFGSVAVRFAEPDRSMLIAVTHKALRSAACTIEHVKEQHLFGRVLVITDQHVCSALGKALVDAINVEDEDAMLDYAAALLVVWRRSQDAQTRHLRACTYCECCFDASNGCKPDSHLCWIEAYAGPSAKLWKQITAERFKRAA